MTNTSSGSSVQFVPANCPVCGGELRVPNNLETVKCIYCGHDILIQNNLVIEKKQNTDRLLDLAQSAEESRNYQQAYQYYSQVLEQDSNIAKAWVGKGISAGYMSSLKSQKISEAITCIKRGILLDNALNRYAATQLAHVILLYTKGLNKYFTKRLYEEMRPPGVILDPVMSGLVISSRRSTSKQQMTDEFRKNYCPYILQGLIFSWQISQDIGVAKRILKTLDEISSFYVLPEEIINFARKKLATTLSEIREKFPEISQQKKKAKCFIITATMQDSNHPYVVLLQQYRDQELLKSNLGKFLVNIYYKYSPFFARFIEMSTLLQKISLYFIVKPAVFVVHNFFLKRK